MQSPDFEKAKPPHEGDIVSAGEFDVSVDKTNLKISLNFYWSHLKISAFDSKESILFIIYVGKSKFQSKKGVFR